jgi:hypothetical protein
MGLIGGFGVESVNVRTILLLADVLVVIGANVIGCVKGLVAVLTRGDVTP